MEVAGQTQVVIGSNVQYVYDELATLLPQGNTSSEKSDGKKGSLRICSRTNLKLIYSAD